MKPHIRKILGYWYCGRAGEKPEIGYTQRHAYERWLNNVSGCRIGVIAESWKVLV